jgi:hypothetical protein
VAKIDVAQGVFQGMVDRGQITGVQVYSSIEGPPETFTW